MKHLLALALSASICLAQPGLAVSVGQNVPGRTAAASFTFNEVMVPMRDGKKLQTVIMTPIGAHGPLPILLRRTPYGVPDKAWDTIPAPLAELAADGYIFVVQNIRGRFRLEGSFSLSTDLAVTPGKGTIETRDGYDAVDWLVRNVPGNVL